MSFCIEQAIVIINDATTIAVKTRKKPWAGASIIETIGSNLRINCSNAVIITIANGFSDELSRRHDWSNKDKRWSLHWR